MHGLVSILCQFCHLTARGGVHACVLSVADVSCIDGLGKEAVAPDNMAVCCSYAWGSN